MNELGMSKGLALEFAQRVGLQAEAEKIQAMHVALPRRAAVEKGCLLDLFEAHGLLDRFIKECWPEGGTDEGRRVRDWYKEEQKRNKELLAARGR